MRCPSGAQRAGRLHPVGFHAGQRLEPDHQRWRRRDRDQRQPGRGHRPARLDRRPGDLERLGDRLWQQTGCRPDRRQCDKRLEPRAEGRQRFRLGGQPADLPPGPIPVRRGRPGAGPDGPPTRAVATPPSGPRSRRRSPPATALRPSPTPTESSLTIWRTTPHRDVTTYLRRGRLTSRPPGRVGSGSSSRTAPRPTTSREETCREAELRPGRLVVADLQSPVFGIGPRSVMSRQGPGRPSADATCSALGGGALIGAAAFASTQRCRPRSCGRRGSGPDPRRSDVFDAPGPTVIKRFAATDGWIHIDGTVVDEGILVSPDPMAPAGAHDLRVRLPRRHRPRRNTEGPGAAQQGPELGPAARLRRGRRDPDQPDQSRAGDPARPDRLATRSTGTGSATRSRCSTACRRCPSRCRSRREFPYFYHPPDPGTYMYHCHFEDVEHVQMGMTGIVFVRPAQNKTGAGGGPVARYNGGPARPRSATSTTTASRRGARCRRPTTASSGSS